MSRVPNLKKLLIVLFLSWAPMQILGSEAQAAQLQLTWTDNSNNEDGFTIFRKTGTSGSYTTIASVGANVTNYTDSTVSSGTTYCYQLAAFNSAGQSATTPEACGAPAAGTPTPAPSPSSGWTFCANEYGQCNFSGTKEVRYGANGVYVSKIFTNGVSCSNSVFGDPLFGFAKQCEYRDATTTGSFTLTVTKAGSGSGSVGSSPGGINGCTSSCSASFSGTVQLTANPSAGSSFAGWSGGGCNGTAGCTVNLTANTTVTATFSLSSSPSPSPSSGWTFCANESGQCNFSGTKEVRYGANGVYVSNIFTNGVSCSNSVFGDPLYGFVKQCEYRDATTTPSPSPEWTFCANESGQCNFSGTKEVRYGANGVYVSKIFTNGVSCSNSVFGDPLYGFVKQCEYRDQATTTAATAAATTNLASTSQLRTTANTNQLPSRIGIFRPSTGQWFLDHNGNGALDCSNDLCINNYGQDGMRPVSGDWNGNGTSSIGTFDIDTGMWHLDNGNYSWDACGAAEDLDRCFTSSGQQGATPVVKENSNDQINIGTYRAQVTTGVNPQQVTKLGVWQFDTDGDGTVDNCPVDECIEGFGNSSADLPVVGDWDSSGVEKIGFFRSTTGEWFLDLNGNGIWDGSGTDQLIASFGMSGDLPIAGDWAGTGETHIGVFRPTTGEWFLDLNGNGSWDGCQIDICISQFGQAGDFPVVGKW